MEIMKYQITKNGDLIASGSFDECWKALLELAGSQTMAEVEVAGYRIEPAGTLNETAW